MIEEHDLPLSPELEYERDKLKRILGDFVSAKELPMDQIWVWEDEFEHYFLPRILGHVQDEGNLWLAQWLDVASAPSVPMGIKCPKTKEILFYCPPLMKTNQFKTYNGDRPLSNVVNTAKNRSANLPGSGNPLLYGYLNGILEDGKEGIDFSEDRTQWLRILARYNYVQVIDGQDVRINVDGTLEEPKAVEAKEEELSVDDIFG